MLVLTANLPKFFRQVIYLPSELIKERVTHQSFSQCISEKETNVLEKEWTVGIEVC